MKDKKASKPKMPKPELKKLGRLEDLTKAKGGRKGDGGNPRTRV